MQAQKQYRPGVTRQEQAYRFEVIGGDQVQCDPLSQWVALLENDQSRFDKDSKDSLVAIAASENRVAAISRARW